jgi:signal transduction histidine kinase/CheY-like chemotaxis protein
MTVTDVDPEFSMAMWSEYWKELRQKGHIVFQTTHRAKDGHSYPVEIQANFLEFGGREYNCTFARDITERKRVDEEREQLQAQLNQSQKMESVGRLAGGVAHDFNNMLGAILGYTELGLQGISAADPIHGTLTDIQKAAQRSVNLTRQLLAFARKQTVAPKLLDLNETIEGTIKMLQRLIGEHIELSWLPGRDLGPVRMDPSQIEQLLANLCVNARDAIHDTGKIIIETGTVTLDETFCAAHVGFTPGKYVLLTVSDDGCGMETETLSHLFEPFFTTKEVGKGTGLGLATVYGIVKQNNGFIDTYSEPCLGTTFKIYLPRYATEAGRIAKTGSAQSAANGHETILLVEDEPMILDITGKMLECQGYTVMAAATPGEAIRLAREHSGDIHLLMTDVVMPEMNGRELAKNLLSLYPKLKRLFMSGYTADVIAHHGVLDEGVQFIQKPFSGQTIAAKVREVLEETKYSTKKSLSDSRESMIRKN